MTAVIASRTPEGEPTRCPVCDSVNEIEPSLFGGDAPCPSCGHLLWPRSIHIAAGSARSRLGQSVEALLRSEPRQPMLGVVATLARQARRVGRVIRAAGRRASGQAPPASTGVYDHWLDG